MPDMTMCSNETCPLRESCYRFAHTPNKIGQSYACFEPQRDVYCAMFIPADAYSVMPAQDDKALRAQ